jgi:hypothetical protein
VLPRAFREPHLLAFFPRRQASRSRRSCLWWRLGRMLSAFFLLTLAVLLGLRPLA